MKKSILAASAASLTLGLVSLVGASAASAHGKSSPTVATGSTTCNFRGVLGAAAGAPLALSGNLTPRHHTKACTSNGGTKLRTGHFAKNSFVSSVTSAGICSFLAGGSLPDIAGGVINWSPKPKVAASQGVDLTSGTLAVVTVGSDTFLQLAYSAGSVTSGSFTNASGASLTAVSSDDVASLTAACAAGPVDAVHFSGSLTL